MDDDKSIKDRARDLMLTHLSSHEDKDGLWVKARFPELEFEVLEVIKSAVSQEREACAELADEGVRYGLDGSAEDMARTLASLIRARSNAS
jgi:hypothetical protein